MPRADDQTDVPLTDRQFTTTHWSVVLAAKGSDTPEAAEALEHLCRTYWPALYAYVRRAGRSPTDAADLTQGFFSRFLEKDFLQQVDRRKGKFRSFLLTTFNHFLADEWRRHHAQKRGGARPALSINTEAWEAVHGHELASDLTPDKLFERRWAVTLFEEALKRLREECVQTGRDQQFDLLKEFLSSPSDDGAYEEAANELGCNTGTVAVQVHRLRKRYGELVRREVAHTVGNPAEVEEELRHLMDVLSG